MPAFRLMVQKGLANRCSVLTACCVSAQSHPESSFAPLLHAVSMLQSPRAALLALGYGGRTERSQRLRVDTTAVVQVPTHVFLDALHRHLLFRRHCLHLHAVPPWDVRRAPVIVVVPWCCAERCQDHPASRHAPVHCIWRY